MTASLNCPHFGVCGGCSELTTPIEAQRQSTIDRVREVLGSHVQGLPIAFTDAPDRPPRHDRMRVLYPVQPLGDNLTMGLYRRGTHDVVELASCEIQHPALTEVGQRALGIFREHRLTPYDEVRHAGVLRGFSARLVASTNELLLGVITATAELPHAERLAEELTNAAAAVDPTIRAVGVVHNVNPNRGNALVGDETHTVRGRAFVLDDADGLRFRISFGSFQQLHRDSDALLYRPALEMLGDVRGLDVVDAFGGMGPFALRLARRSASRVTLVELNRHGCADARHNARENGLPQIQVVEASFESAEMPANVDLLVVDPTRAGLGAAGCERAQALAAPSILYVACGLKALARDLSRLQGYRVAALRLADLFPHTPHVETIARLERTGN